MAANMYRVGDYVYFENSSTSPYLIRRIEELNKTPTGNVEAKVMCFYRRRDISSSLILLADKHQNFGGDADKESADSDGAENNSSAKKPTTNGTVNGHVTAQDDVTAGSDSACSSPAPTPAAGDAPATAPTGAGGEELTDKQRHQMKHRELFLSRQVETLPATHIRGKCAVTLLNETESLLSYINKDDAFFYSLVYDPQQKTLLADKGEIRVGSRYQAEVCKSLKEEIYEERKSENLEELVWTPTPENGLADREIDQFMVIARSVGTFARALDCTSTVRQPSLHMSAAAASRDVTLFQAMDVLHKHKYDLSKAISSLVPTGGPVLCRDEMEEWSASEANFFEEALDKYGKDFNDIKLDFLPWKALKSIVEYYYMWKTTDRYVQQKRIKAAEAESKLKQVYIPNYNKPNPAQIMERMNGIDGITTRACESCYAVQSNSWYVWGPSNMNCRLCSNCWSYWKKFGGLRMPTRLDGERPGPDQRGERLAHMAALRMHRCTIADCGKEFKLRTHLTRHLATAHGLAIRSGSPRPVMKTRAAFCLITTPLTRVSRQVCSEILCIHRAARQPFTPINISEIKQECQVRLPKVLKSIKSLKSKKCLSADVYCKKLGVDISLECPILSKHGKKKEATTFSFPVLPPNKRDPNFYKPTSEKSSLGGTPSIMKKRGYDQINGLDNNGPHSKRPSMGVIRMPNNVRESALGVRGSAMNHLNGRCNKMNFGRGRKQNMLNWMDAPDDVYFVSTDATRKLRKQMTQPDFKRAARKPWRKLNVRTPYFSIEAQSLGPAATDPIVILD